MHVQELLRVAEDLAALKGTQGTNAKKELAVQWRRPEHAEILNMIGDTNRQWYTTWESVCRASPLDDGCDWSDLWYEAESRIASPTATAGRIAHLVSVGYPELLLKAIVEKTPDCGLSYKEFLKARGVTRPFSIALAADWLKMTEVKRVEVLRTAKYATTPKMDGLRCLFRLIPGQEAVLSRAMKPLKNQGALLASLLEWFKGYPCCVDGEILAKDWNETVTATKNSSGGNIKAKFYPFDLVTADEYLSGTYIMKKVQRMAELNKRIKYGGLVSEVPFDPVFNVSEVRSEMSNHLSQGFEGSVLHDMTAVYRPKADKAENRTLAWIKVKTFLSAEFTCLNILPGSGKHLGRMGSILVEGTVDGVTLKSEVGTGFTDQERQDIWDNQQTYRGMTAEVKYFESTKHGPTNGSLRFPSFLRWRSDL